MSIQLAKKHYARVSLAAPLVSGLLTAPLAAEGQPAGKDIRR